MPKKIMKYPLALIAAALLAAQASIGFAASNAHTKPDPGWIDLFAYDSFAQWQQHNGEPVDRASWSITNGVVHFTKTGNPNRTITTHEKYTNFELRFDWKISAGGNSGIKYRISPEHTRLGLEYQILDDENHPDNKKATSLAGSLYDIVPARADKPINPVGEWNSGRIVVKGDLIQHWLNGEKILEVVYGSDAWSTAFQNSKYSNREGFGSWYGPILLQDHQDDFWIRNMHIRQL